MSQQASEKVYTVVLTDAEWVTVTARAAGAVDPYRPVNNLKPGRLKQELDAEAMCERLAEALAKLREQAMPYRPWINAVTEASDALDAYRQSKEVPSDDAA
jgi:hypothetical protein